MSRFLKSFMAAKSLDAANYALADRGGTDLSLVTGPYFWADVVQPCLDGMDDNAVARYASPAQDTHLVAAIAAREGVSESNVWLVAGADNGIELVLSRFLEGGGRLGILEPNFPRFAIVSGGLAGVAIERFSTLEAIPRGLSMVVLCTPCNPTTDELDEQAVRRVVAEHPDTLFCIDAVFAWYGRWYPAGLVCDYDNVVVIKSYSKIGLAGLRLGYVLGEASLVADIRSGRSPFSVPSVSQAVGLAVEGSLGRIDAIREWLELRAERLQASLGDAMHRTTPVPFYVLKIGGESAEAARALAGKGIMVVDGSRFNGMAPGRLRIAIGDDNENALLLQALGDLALLG